MKIDSIFEKPIDRPIEGVIKADDDAGLLNEVEEYVLTNEVAQRLEDFLNAYNNYEVANGVWISGFFGSGKSHLLKMMALLLENRVIDGFPTLEIFLPKCGDNHFLRAELQRAVSVPSRSILFNIDQKADIISKKEFDAVLAVFVKVFDEMRGYYGKQGHIARFERDLDNQGLYEDFKTAYTGISGQSWEAGREIALLEGSNIAAAYAAVTGKDSQAAAGILDKYREEYSVSIEDFADEVQAYIETQEADFRLNFYVDEVGQYIADNVKLMTNLQTIAESLATKSRGRSWLIVTAQEEIGSVIGELDRQLGQDFSKIQARFANRMNLTSADVAEVIRQRLLLKNGTGVDYLSEVYALEKNNFRTFFDFSDGARTYANFRDREDFIYSYPFIPYQFVLFQSAIQGLSGHNAFQGRHSSVGERSMLGVFQNVVVNLSDLDVGRLATFDLMYEGIRTALKSQVQKSILTAEHNLDDDFAVQLLKALFLVKYVKEFKATPRNLAVLMLDSFETDPNALHRRVQAALDLLEQQTYVLRRGDEYEYLTEEEKDIEEEIKNTEVEAGAVLDTLAEVIYDEILRVRKIRYENNQDYSFKRKIDDRLLGRDYELGINLITPFHEHSEDEKILRSQSMGRDDLLVILPPDARLMRDLTLYEQTRKYVRQNTAQTQKDSVRRILTEKTHQNNTRRAAIREQVEDAVGKALLLTNGETLDIPSAEAQSRLVRGFHELVRRTYTNLGMLRDITYTADQLGIFLRPQTSLLGDDPASFSEAEQEILSYIESETKAALRPTMQKVVARFEHKPYGWYLAAIQCNVAKLLGRGKIEAQRDSANLENNSLEEALRNSHGFANLLLIPQAGFSDVEIRDLRRFHSDYFDGPPLANEAKALGLETKAAFIELASTLNDMVRETRDYPFATEIKSAYDQIAVLSGKQYTYYLKELSSLEEDLFTLKENVTDPMRRFLSGSQKGIYDEASRLLRDQGSNFAYIDGDQDRQLRELLADPRCYVGPQMQRAKALVDDLRSKTESLLQQEKERTRAKIDEKWQQFISMPQFADLTGDQQAQLALPFEQLKTSVDQQQLIDVIRGSLSRFNENKLPALLEQVRAWTKKDETVINDGRGSYVTSNALDIAFDKLVIENEADVERYLEALRKALIAAITRGDRVQL